MEKWIKSYVCVAQLDRASGYGPEGRRFESCHVHCVKTKTLQIYLQGFLVIYQMMEKEVDIYL